MEVFKTVDMKKSIVIKGYFKHYRPHKGDVIMDVGAGGGDNNDFFSLYVSRKIGKKGKIFCYEPDEKNYTEMVNVLNTRKIGNAFPFKLALGNETTSRRFNEIGDGSSSFVLEDHWCENLGKEGYPKNIVECKCTTIDNEAIRLNLSHVDFIKMDVQGSEIDIIKGARRTLSNYDVNLAIASYHIVNGRPTHEILEGMLRDMGYTVETSHPKHLTTYAWSD